MAKLVKGTHTVETSLPSEVTALKSHGYKEVKHDDGGPLSAGPTALINETGHVEVIKPAPKPENKK